MKKRVFCLFLCLVMVLSLMPNVVIAAEPEASDPGNPLNIHYDPATQQIEWDKREGTYDYEIFFDGHNGDNNRLGLHPTQPEEDAFTMYPTDSELFYNGYSLLTWTSSRTTSNTISLASLVSSSRARSLNWVNENLDVKDWIYVTHSDNPTGVYAPEMGGTAIVRGWFKVYVEHAIKDSYGVPTVTKSVADIWIDWSNDYYPSDIERIGIEIIGGEPYLYWDPVRNGAEAEIWVFGTVAGSNTGSNCLFHRNIAADQNTVSLAELKRVVDTNPHGWKSIKVTFDCANIDHQFRVRKEFSISAAELEKGDQYIRWTDYDDGFVARWDSENYDVTINYPYADRTQAEARLYKLSLEPGKQGYIVKSECVEKVIISLKNGILEPGTIDWSQAVAQHGDGWYYPSVWAIDTRGYNYDYTCFSGQYRLYVASDHFCFASTSPESGDTLSIATGSSVDVSYTLDLPQWMTKNNVNGVPTPITVKNNRTGVETTYNFSGSGQTRSKNIPFNTAGTYTVSYYVNLCIGTTHYRSMPSLNRSFTVKASTKTPLDTPVPVLRMDGQVSWSSVGACEYHVVLQDNAFNEIVAIDIPQPSCDLSKYMTYGKTYRCCVTAISDSETRADSAVGKSQWVTFYPGDFYNVWIGSTPITSVNKNDVLGDGTVTYYLPGEYHGVNVANPVNTYGDTFPTLVLDNFIVNKQLYHSDGTSAAQIYISGDLNIVLKGTNTLYKYGNAHGIYLADGGYVWFYGNGTLNVDTSWNDYDAMVCESSAIRFCENVKVNLTGAHGLRYNKAGVGDDDITIMDHARVNCYAKQTSDSRDYPAMDACSIGIIDDGWLICEAQYNCGALYDWGDPFPNKYYDIKILKIGEYRNDGIQPYTPAEGIDVTGGVWCRDCRYISIHSKAPVDCGGDAGSCILSQFTDAPKYTNWAHAGIEYCVRRGLMSGVSATTFEPKSTMSRAMLVTVLYRMEGEPGPGETTFTDVKPGRWYSDAVSWAADNGIVAGMGGGTFVPNGNVTREQIATFLYRYANYKGMDTSGKDDLTGFADADKVGKWYVDAMQWAVADGLINGTASNGKTCLNPKGDATREQVAAILMRFCMNRAI